MIQYPRNWRYAPRNGLLIDWGAMGNAFPDCCLPDPICPEAPEPGTPCCAPFPIPDPIDTYDWAKFTPEVMVGIDEPDREIAMNYTRQAAIRLAADSRVLQREMYIQLSKGTCSYPLNPIPIERIVGVIGVAFDNERPCACQDGCTGRLQNGIKFSFNAAQSVINLEGHFNDCCCGARLLRVLVWAAPTETACRYDKYLYDAFRETITIKARRDYVRAQHFRDRYLMASCEDPLTIDRAYAKAKTDAMVRHSFMGKEYDSMWGSTCRPYGLRRGGRW